jgi:Ca2+-binding RTX toxin-like protein
MGNYISGNSAANLLSGGAGDDRIRGGGGLDIIYGGAGDDELEGLFQIYGGAGNDRIVTSTYISNGSDPIYELAGGPGDDLYQVSQPQHPYGVGSIVEHAGEGRHPGPASRRDVAHGGPSGSCGEPAL